MHIGIRGRLLLLILGITIPFAVIGVLDLRRVWNISRSQLNHSMQQQAELAALAFERWADAQRRPLDTIAAIAADGKIESLDPIEYIVRNHPYWIDLTVVNTSGKIIRSHSRADDPPHPALIEYLLTQTDKRQTWVLVTDRTRDESRPIVGIGSPIKGVGGAVIARVDGSAINALFRHIQLPNGAALAVFDSQGRLLYRQQTPDTPPLTEGSSSPLFAALGEQRVAVAELRSPYDEVRRLYGLSRVGPTDFVIAVGVPSATLYEPMQRQFIRYLFFIFLAVVCAVVAAILMQRQIARPIQRLSVAAHALGKGDFSVSAPVDASGEIGDLGAAFNKMAREIKEREERLTELDRLKSDFVSSVSHELRTPLTTISTLTHVLQRTNPTDAERREYLQTIAAECDRQIELVTNLLDLSRIESGAYRMSPVLVDTSEILRDCARLARHGAEMRQQELRLELPRDPVEVLADRTALRRGISTLLENAIKYTADEGEIVLGMKAIAGEVRIYIKDNGRGIDPRDLPHIFERFYQGRTVNPDAAAGIRAERPGVGLGLYVVRGLIEQLGGRITVDSKLGRGSTFTIHLPQTNANENQVTSNVETIAFS